jgi:hypothetical protein
MVKPKVRWRISNNRSADSPKVMELWINRKKHATFVWSKNKGSYRTEALRACDDQDMETVVGALFLVALGRRRPVYFRWKLDFFVPTIDGLFSINSKGEVAYGNPTTSAFDRETDTPILSVFHTIIKRKKDQIRA